MGKGLIILIAVGGLFAYFVYNFVSDVQNSDVGGRQTDVTYQPGSTDPAAAYIVKDATGAPVLDLSGVSLETAKKIWRESEYKNSILSHFPDFKLVRDTIGLRIAPGPFRDYLLKTVEQVESDYLGGAVDAHKALVTLQRLP